MLGVRLKPIALSPLKRLKSSRQLPRLLLSSSFSSDSLLSMRSGGSRRGRNPMKPAFPRGHGEYHIVNLSPHFDTIHFIAAALFAQPRRQQGLAPAESDYRPVPLVEETWLNGHIVSVRAGSSCTRCSGRTFLYTAVFKDIDIMCTFPTNHFEVTYVINPVN
jgi:hypothetical protein